MKAVGFQGPVTALNFQDSRLYAGIGPYILIFDWREGVLLSKHRVFNYNSVHGIEFVENTCKFLAFGGRSFSIIDTFSMMGKETFMSDWIISAKYCNGLVYLLQAHNQLQVWNLEENKSETITCFEKSLLYSGNIFFCENRTLVASGTVMDGLILWNLRNNCDLQKLRGHDGSIFGIAFSNTGSLIASCSDDRSIILWDVKSGKMIARAFGHSCRVWKLHFSRDTKILYSASEDGTLRSWSLPLLKPLATFQGHRGRNIWSLALSEDVLATGGGDGRVKLWDIASTSDKMSYSIDDITSDSFKGELVKDFRILGNRLLVTTSAGRAFRYDGISWRLVHTNLDEYSMVRQAGMALLIVTRTGDIYLDGTLQKFDPFFEGIITEAIELGRCDTRQILLQAGRKGMLYLLDLETGKTCKYIPPNGFQVSSATVTETLLVAGSRSGNVAVWLLKDHSIYCHDKVLGSDTITTIEATQSDFFIASRNGRYGYFTKELIPISINRLPQGTFDGISPDGELAVGFRADKFFIFNIKYDYEVFTERCGGGHRIWCINFNAQGEECGFQFVFLRASRLTVVTKKTRTVFHNDILMNGIHGREIRDLKWSKTHNLLASTSEDTSIVLSNFDGSQVQPTMIYRNHISGVHAAKWSGEYLVTSGGRNELIVSKVYGSNRIVEVARLPSSSSGLRIMAFDVTLDGKNYYVGYSDGSLKHWLLEDRFRLMGQTQFSNVNRCVLSLHVVENVVIACGSDGALAIMRADFTDMSHFHPHQSGIRASAVKQVGSIVIVVTGGEDNALCGLQFNLATLEPQKLFFSRIAHSSTITAIALDADHIYSTGSDQKICTWTHQGRLLSQHIHEVGDAGALEVVENKILIAGAGVAVYDITEGNLA